MKKKKNLIWGSSTLIIIMVGLFVIFAFSDEYAWVKVEKIIAERDDYSDLYNFKRTEFEIDSKKIHSTVSNWKVVTQREAHSLGWEKPKIINLIEGEYHHIRCNKNYDEFLTILKKDGINYVFAARSKILKALKLKGGWRMTKTSMTDVNSDYRIVSMPPIVFEGPITYYRY